MMKSRLLLLPLCLLLLLAGCNRQSATNRDKERQAVLQSYEQMKQSWNKGDLAGLDAVFRPDTIFIDASNTGQVEHWASVRLEVEKSAQAVHPVLSDAGQPVVNFSPDADTAWMATKYHVRADTPQGPIEGNGILTLALLRLEGKYRIVLFHSARVP